MTVEDILKVLLCTKCYLSIFPMVASGKGIHSMKEKEQVLNIELAASLGKWHKLCLMPARVSWREEWTPYAIKIPQCVIKQ